MEHEEATTAPVHGHHPAARLKSRQQGRVVPSLPAPDCVLGVVNNESPRYARISRSLFRVCLSVVCAVLFSLASWAPCSRSQRNQWHTVLLWTRLGASVSGVQSHCHE